jgi:hypothetical protein
MLLGECCKGLYLCCSFASFSWFWGLVSSQYLISTRWISRRVLLRALGRCCLGLVALLVAGGAAEVLPVSLNCPLPATSKNPPPYISLLFLCFCRDGSNQHKIWAVGGTSVFIWEAGWEEPFGNYSTFRCFRERCGDFAWSSVRCCLYPWRQCMILRSLFCW